MGEVYKTFKARLGQSKLKADIHLCAPPLSQRRSFVSLYLKVFNEYPHFFELFDSFHLARRAHDGPMPLLHSFPGHTFFFIVLSAASSNPFLITFSPTAASDPFLIIFAPTASSNPLFIIGANVRRGWGSS